MAENSPQPPEPGTPDPDADEVGNPAPSPSVPPGQRDTQRPDSEPPAQPASQPTWHILADEHMPGLRTLALRQRYFYLLAAVCIALGGLTVAYFANYVFDRATSDSRARSDKSAEKNADLEKPPFVATVTFPDYDQDTPYGSAILIDRPLTAKEQEQLKEVTTPEAAWSLLKPLGGRILLSGPYFYETSDSGGLDDRGMTQPFNLNLNSDRNSGLTINDLKAVVDKCYTPSAKAVAIFPLQGTESRQGLLWDIGGASGQARGPYIPEYGEEQGNLFFSQHAIDLGNGQANAALLAQPLNYSRTCEWHIEASYTDTSGAHTKRIPDGRKTFISEAVPPNPDQYFIHYPGMKWMCSGQVVRSNCDFRSGQEWGFRDKP